MSKTTLKAAPKAIPAAARAVRANDFSRPYTTVDVVIFTVLSDALKVLLVQRPADTNEPFPGLWALPGGLVDTVRDEDLLACARRKLLEKTGVAPPYLEQLGSWGSASRDPRGWFATHVYFTLMPAQNLKLARGANAADVAWFEVNRLTASSKTTELAFDHADILCAAVERLRGKVEYTSLPAFLLPEPFTLPQLQRTYEVVLGRPVDKSGFRTRMIGADFLEEAGLVESDSNRPPMGYRLKNHSAPVFFPRTFSPRHAD
jgi:8-oxo-dGTP diphosphatase